MLIGGEINEVRSLSARFGGWAGELDELARAVTSSVGSAVGTVWMGAAARDFGDRWTGQYLPALRSMVEALRACQTELDRRAALLEQADTRI